MASPGTYTKTAIWLHWIIAILILFMLFPGEELIEVQEGASLAGWGPSAHASIGILILVLTLVRLGWRLANPPPALPATMPGWQATASHALHALFYVLMVGMPISGMLALSAYGAERLDADAVTFFRLFSLNVMTNLGEWTGEMHELASKLMQVLLIVHVAAALKHQFWDRDGLLKRMSPH